MIKALVMSLSILMCTLSFSTTATDIKELNPIQSLKISSKLFKGPIEYNVTLPKSYHEAKAKDKKYFVIFDLHPRSQPYLSGLHDWLSHNGDWPWLESIVVTPASYNAEFAELFRQLEKEPQDNSLLDYFENDLLTSIDENYRTNGFKIYSGFMGNGAFGLFTLLNRPSLFNAYIITSPSLANDFAMITSQAKMKLTATDDKMRFLYLATGTHQYEQGNLPAFDLFEEALKTSAPETLDWQVHRNTSNYYMSQPIISTINAIEALFSDIHIDLAPDSKTSQQGVQAIIDYYGKISQKKYGFSVSAEGSLKTLAKSVMEKDSQKGLAIYQKTAELYPESAYALSSLAKAYADLDDIHNAIKYQTLAVEKSKSLIQWHQNKHQEYLKHYQESLANKHQ
ncbi:esterase [Colwellia sp. 1_MG-2023]|uniref:esterase n=1 Tax=Colwellia sp. 1_MG-2023 TaxID=3062649 RepID=UPI0026E435E3|nr:esterase [Colwellia sp. 1_MG-2023]MDO6444548.1 esterase [Colwellia sp. 1_MG-2023]